MLTDGKYEYVEYIPKSGAGESVKERLRGKGELLGFCKRMTGKDSYYRIRFTCGHECFIRVGKNLECNNKDCLKEKMSNKRRIIFNTPEHREKMSRIGKEVQSRPEVREKHRKFFAEYWGKEENRKINSDKKIAYFSNPENRKAQAERTAKYFKDESHRKKTSDAVKKTFEDREFKKKYLESRVDVERKKRNADEVLFMQMLDDLNIEYIWQVPLLTESGKGYVLDFYLPGINLYVNIDGSVHGGEGIKEHYVVNITQDRDRQLDEYCKKHNINICHIKVNDLRSFGFNLKEVIGI